MEKVLFEMIIQIVLVLTMTSLPIESHGEFHCTSDRRCICRFDSVITANCSRLSITNENIPIFNETVASVDLSQNKLTKVPDKLPYNIKFLNLTQNDLGAISRDSFLHYKKLLFLTLNSCNLKVVEEGSFKNQRELTYLSISNNKELSLFALPNITFDLQFSNLTILHMNEVQCRSGHTITLLKKHTKYLNNIKLEEISLAMNRISLIEVGLIRNLPRTIRHIDVSDNSFSAGWYLLELGYLTSLQSINIGVNKLGSLVMFDPCNDCKNYTVPCSSNVQRQSQIFHKNRFKGQNITISAPPKLQKLYAQNLNHRVSVIMSNTLHVKIKNTETLTHLYLRDNLFTVLVNIMGLKSVKYLDLSNNFCTHISTECFKEMEQLEHLDLSSNYLAKIIEQQGEIFQKTQQLKFLNLSNNFIYNLHKHIFSNLSNLHLLDLSNNKLQRLNVNLINMKNISTIDLSNNEIRFFDKTTMDALDTVSRTKGLNLSLMGNTLACTCESLNFLKWIDTSTKIKFLGQEYYSCIHRNGTITLNHLSKLIQQMNIECTSFTAVIFVITSLILTFVTVVVCRIIYRFRWKLRYLYYVAKQNYRRERYSLLTEDYQCHQYHFDAFISYANEDRLLILPNILQTEKNNNLKFCIHNRDFIPGTAIAENITNAIHNSRRTICFLSKSYMKSEWCKYELNMARMESIYSRAGRSVILLVLLESNIIQQVPAICMDVIESKTYLEYHFGREENILFWRKFTECVLSND